MLPNKRRKYGNNKKVVDGVKFDSELELYCYNMLKTLGFDFDFQVPITLVEKFKFNKESIRAITMIVDFLVRHNGRLIYIDSKGFPTEVSKIKYKMLKFSLKDKASCDVVWLHTKKEVNSYILNLKEEENVIIKQSNIAW